MDSIWRSLGQSLELFLITRPEPLLGLHVNHTIRLTCKTEGHLLFSFFSIQPAHFLSVLVFFLNDGPTLSSPTEHQHRVSSPVKNPAFHLDLGVLRARFLLGRLVKKIINNQLISAASWESPAISIATSGRLATRGKA